MKRISTELLALDVKDQKILAELFKDGRASYSTIAKSTLLSKDAVQYRISKFVESGFMTNISTIVDISKLNWSSAIVFFKLANIDKSKIKKLIDSLVKNPLVVEILELAGGWDLAVRFYYKDMEHLNHTINEFSDLVSEHEIFFISKNILHPYNALFEEYAFDFKEEKFESCKLDELDFKILESLSSDGRKSLEDLSRELKENRMTLHNRIKKLVRSGVIQAFRPNLFTEKLGFHWYLISLRTQDASAINEIKSIFPVHLIMNGFGFTDIVFYVQVRTVQELQRVLYGLREKLNIKSIESANVIKDYKWDFFPRGFLELLE